MNVFPRPENPGEPGNLRGLASRNQAFRHDGRSPLPSVEGPATENARPPAEVEDAGGQPQAWRALDSPRHVGFRPGDPCPDLLTEEEAIRYLRLDLIDIKDRRATLARYRKEGHLRGTQISKRVFYLRDELDGFLGTMTEHNPR
jgi:hypothetical protein